MSDYLWITESYVNATENYIFGDCPPYETSYTSLGKLFRSLTKEYGRCVSKVYRDTKTREAMPIGWVFQKRMEYDERWPRYDDWGRKLPVQTYIREVWVTVLSADDTVQRTRNYVDIGRSRRPLPPAADA